VACVYVGIINCRRLTYEHITHINDPHFQYFQKLLFPLDFAADLLFVMDIIKHFNTGYIDEFDFSIMNAPKVQLTPPLSVYPSFRVHTYAMCVCVRCDLSNNQPFYFSSNISFFSFMLQYMIRFDPITSKVGCCLTC
jgi:hypothetical protein